MGLGDVKWATIGPCDREITVRGPASMRLSLAEEDAATWQERTLELYDALHLALLRYLRRLGLSMEQGEDVIQETFVRLAEHLREGGGGNLRSWIFRVAHNLSMDIHRASQRNHRSDIYEGRPVEEPVDPRANPEREYLQKEEAQRVNAALARLTPQQSSSLLLRAEGLRYWEIASVLKVSEQRAIHLVKRGLARLAGGV